MLSSENTTLSKNLIDTLIEKINREMHANEKMPSERQLVKIYQVSRTTVRNALDELEIKGYIYRQHGRGTFVSYRPKGTVNLADTFSFSEYMKKQGLNPETKIIYFKSRKANRHQAHMLQVQIDTPIYELKRIRLADNQPLMIERTFLNPEIFPDLTLEKLQKKGLYDLFNDEYGVKLRVADETCTATIADKDSEFLKVPKHSPCLSLERVTQDKLSRVVEFTLSIARADKFDYHVRMYYQG